MAKALNKLDHELEDYVLAVEYENGKTLGCVFDGHGCHTVAEYCTDRVPELVKLQLRENEQDHRTALESSLTQLDPELREAYGNNRDQLADIGGSTALVALLDRVSRKLTLAYLGDGRAILCRTGVGLLLNEEHNPCNPRERARVLAAGGTIDEDDRVKGEEEDCSLAVSRSIGDFDYKTDENRSAVVICVPDVEEVILDAGDEFLILSSDGTQCWTDQELVDFVRPRIMRGEDLNSICEDLLREVDGGDDTGLVILKF